MGRKEVEDLTGRTFGRWTVLGRAEDRYNSRNETMRYWHCKCSCSSGEEREIYERSLRDGKSKSCGCLIEETRIDRLKEYIGKKYNHWTVIDIAKPRRSKSGNLINYLLCECNCEQHTIREVSDRALKHNKSKSCGCFQRIILRQTQRNRVEDISGNKYGRLTPIRYDDEYINSNGNLCSVWWCKCDCGNPDLVPVTKSQLVTGKTKSCGCLVKEMLKERNKNNQLYNRYDLSGEYGIGYDTNGNEFYFDLEDYDKIKNYNWKFTTDATTKTQYVQSHYYKDDGTRSTIRFSRLIMDCYDENLEVDHINRINYDNRKSNLRICDRFQNSHNKHLTKANMSSVPGIDDTDYGYRVRICHLGKRYNLGVFSDFTKAAMVRLTKEEELFKDFMPTEHRKILAYLRDGNKLKYGDKELIEKIVNG